MTSTTTLTGHDAIEYAESRGLTLNKYSDPTEDAREGLTIDEAREIAREDPALVWVEAAGDDDDPEVDDEQIETQIETLLGEAAAAGDHSMVATCQAALGLDVTADVRPWEQPPVLDRDAARARCAEVIAEAQREHHEAAE